jgi:NADPH:quinone reductase-like Zn-dependent oxidoreductase
VLATGTADVADYLRELGAHTVIDFTETPTHAQVAAAHPDGIDAMLDLVTPAGTDFSSLTDPVRDGGTVVSTHHDPRSLAGRGIQGANLANDPTPETLTELARLAASGDLRVRIEQTVSLHEVPEAVAKARADQARGKTVILP